jgi:retron-type reverse transcriptase
LLQGKYEFGPARRISIKKRGNKGERNLRIASPREKIVQKALQIVLEAI